MTVSTLPFPPIVLPALVAVCAYLLGSIPFAILTSRFFGLADPRNYGSGNPGATNVLRSGNKLAAVCTLLGDSMKGWLAVYLTHKLTFYAPLVGLSALAVFLGHLFPIFLKFKGGKGVATAAGVLFAIDVYLGLAVTGTWLGMLLACRYVSLASVSAAIAALICALWFQKAFAWPVALIVLLLIVKHRSNLRRLKDGQEPRVGTR